MKLDKENTRQILKIVIIAIIVLVALINIEPVWNVVKTTLSILSPFIWGLAIAFILNIFMTLYENKLFRLGKKNKRGTARQDNKTKVAIKENESLKIKPIYTGIFVYDGIRYVLTGQMNLETFKKVIDSFN